MHRAQDRSVWLCHWLGRMGLDHIAGSAMKTLHIAPGDSAGGSLIRAIRDAGRDDQVLPFRDDLSCGPIGSDDPSARASGGLSSMTSRSCWKTRCGALGVAPPDLKAASSCGLDAIRRESLHSLWPGPTESERDPMKSSMSPVCDCRSGTERAVLSWVAPLKRFPSCRRLG
jgi:hypothetical protein